MAKVVNTEVDIRSARLTLWLCFAGAVLEGYDLQVLAVAGPLLRAAMQLNPQQVGLALSASLVGLAVGAAWGGTVADRVGRKKVLIVSILGLALMTLATSLAGDFRSLLTMRILAGVAMGGAMPNLIAIAAAASGAGRTTSKVTAMVCGMPAGGIIAALGAHALAADFGWQGLFVLGGATTLAIVPLLMWGLTESKPLLNAGKAAISWRESLFGNGRTRATVLLWLLFILTLAMLSLFSGWAPTLVVDKGLPPAAGFSALLAINVGGIVGGLIAAALCDRWSTRNTMLATYVGMAASLWMFSRSNNAAAIIPLAGLVGFFVLGGQFALYGISPRMYPAAGHGSGVGSAVAAGRIGSILGPVIAGVVMSHGIAANDVVAGLVPVALLSGLLLWMLSAVSGEAVGRKG